MDDVVNLKNDVTIKGVGADYVLRPSFGCLIAIEAKAGRSLLKIIEEMANGTGRVTDLAVILREGTRASGIAMTDAETQSFIEDNGVVNITTQLTDFFVKAMYGGKVQEDQAKKK